jgi:hypothetical protein
MGAEQVVMIVTPEESEIHHKMKAIEYALKTIGYARLENDYPEATIELESNLEGRIPDVLFELFLVGSLERALMMLSSGSSAQNGISPQW